MFDALVQYGDLLQKAIWETLLMVGITMGVAIIVGGPLGLVLYLTGRGGLMERRWFNEVLGYAVNALRSFPFIILLVILIPVTRFLVGTSIGPRAAAVGLSVAAIPFFARLVEQSLRDVDVRPADAARVDLQHHLAGPGHRVRCVIDREFVPAAPGCHFHDSRAP